MIVLLDTSHSLDVAEKEIGYPCEQLFTPLTRFKPQRPEQTFAIDNGAYANFNPKAFLALLERERPRRHLCRFVSIPDVIVNRVGNARRTLEVFEHWQPMLRDHWKLAFVCQDGMENFNIPFADIDAIFIGGSTNWKESDHAEGCIKAAKAIGKWVHVGRVNSPARFEKFEQMGVDSIDGTGIALKTHMREKIRDRNSDARLFPMSAMVTI